jgi:hypothetical protein
MSLRSCSSGLSPGSHASSAAAPTELRCRKGVLNTGGDRSSAGDDIDGTSGRGTGERRCEAGDSRLGDSGVSGARSWGTPSCGSDPGDRAGCSGDRADCRAPPLGAEAAGLGVDGSGWCSPSSGAPVAAGGDTAVPQSGADECGDMGEALGETGPGYAVARRVSEGGLSPART